MWARGRKDLTPCRAGDVVHGSFGAPRLCPPDIAAVFGKIMTDQRCSSFKTFLRRSRRAAEARYSALAARRPRVLAPDEAMAPRADHFLSGHCLS